MRTYNETIQLLIDHFNRDGWPIDLNEMKTWNRATVVRDDKIPGGDIVRIERHRSILNVGYIRGVGMAAFVTYYMRYSVSDNEGAVTKLEEQQGEATLDEEAVASALTESDRLVLRVRRLPGGDYRIYDSASNSSEIVSSLEQALSFGDCLADGFDEIVYEYFSMERGEGTFTGEQATYSANSVSKAIREIILNKIRALWKNRELVEYDDE